MRPIKFRAWDKENGVMMTEVSLYFSNGVWSDEKIEIMQFTGLLDKNEKEIYEGDIVEDKSSNYGLQIVVWNNRFASYGQTWPKGFTGSLNEDHYPFAANNWSLVEVIGNIYENPTLLEK